MKKLHIFKSNSIKKLKQIMECFSFKKIINTKYNLLTVIVIVIVVSFCANIAWGKRGNINYFLKNAKQKIVLFANFKKPLISEVNVSDISKHNAKIIWKTSKLTKTKFYLGTDTNYTLWQESFNRLSYDHWLNKIPELKQGTTYHFKIVAIDRSGNETECDDYAFDTLGDKNVLVATSSDDELVKNKKINDNQNLTKPINDTKNISKKSDKTKDFSNADIANENIIQSTTKHIITTGNTHDAQAYMLSIGLCTDLSCPTCQYCYKNECIDRPEGYDDCSGCQRCVKGKCKDYNPACPTLNQCILGSCVQKNQKTFFPLIESDNSCGYEKNNCNISDGWYNTTGDSTKRVPEQFPSLFTGIVFPTCLENSLCQMKKQYYRNYQCYQKECKYKITNTKDVIDTCIPCKTNEKCTAIGCVPEINETYYKIPTKKKSSLQGTPCEGIDMRDMKYFNWQSPFCDGDKQWNKKYYCQKYLESQF